MSAKTLSTGLYENLKAGRGRAEALREIKLRMIHGEEDENYRYPFFWAPAGSIRGWTVVSVRITHNPGSASFHGGVPNRAAIDWQIMKRHPGNGVSCIKTLSRDTKNAASQHLLFGPEDD